VSSSVALHPLLEGCTLGIQVPVSWGHMDSFAHVNNTQYFRWFEDVRIQYFEAIGLIAHMTTHQVGPILAHTDCRFKAPVAYPDTVHVGTQVTDVGEDRFTMQYRLVSERLDVVAAEGSGRIVIYDYAAGKKAPIPPAVRALIGELSG